MTCKSTDTRYATLPATTVSPGSPAQCCRFPGRTAYASLYFPPASHQVSRSFSPSVIVCIRKIWHGLFTYSSQVNFGFSHAAKTPTNWRVPGPHIGSICSKLQEGAVLADSHELCSVCFSFFCRYSVTDAAYPVPIEIHDYIVDFLWDDVAAQCCLAFHLSDYLPCILLIATRRVLIAHGRAFRARATARLAQGFRTPTRFGLLTTRKHRLRISLRCS